LVVTKNPRTGLLGLLDRAPANLAYFLDPSELGANRGLPEMGASDIFSAALDGLSPEMGAPRWVPVTYSATYSARLSMG
jgi:hypothetical protein